MHVVNMRRSLIAACHVREMLDESVEENVGGSRKFNSHCVSASCALQCEKTSPDFLSFPVLFRLLDKDRTNERSNERRTSDNSRKFIESNRRKVTGLWGNFHHVLTRKIYVYSASGEGTENHGSVHALLHWRERDCQLHCLAIRA